MSSHKRSYRDYDDACHPRAGPAHDDDEPWWERDRRGGGVAGGGGGRRDDPSHARDPHSARPARPANAHGRYEDRTYRTSDRDPGYRGPPGRGGAGGGGGGYRDLAAGRDGRGGAGAGGRGGAPYLGESSHDPRRSDPYPPPSHGQRSSSSRDGPPYSSQSQPRYPYPPAAGHSPRRGAAEEGEIYLDYDAAPPSRSNARYSSDRPHAPRQASPPRASDSSRSGPSTSSRPSEQPPREEDATPLNLDPVEEPDPEKVLAERRRKRAEILAKYSKPTADAPPPTTRESKDPASGALTGTGTDSVKVEVEEADVGTPGRAEVERAAKRLKLGTASPAVSASTTDPSRATSVELLSTSVPLSNPSEFDLSKASDATRLDSNASTAVGDGQGGGSSGSGASRKGEKHHTSEITGEVEEEVSAADYNPDFDRREDEKRMERLEARQRGNKEVETIEVEAEEDDEEAGQEGEEGEDEDDEDDMFAIGTEEEGKKKKKTKKAKPATVRRPPFPSVVNRNADPATLKNPSLLADNYDDAEGYYKVILGEVLDSGRYLVQANLGKGMFSSVVKAKDLGVDGKGIGDGERKDVAIKMVRSQESMYKAGMKEAQILRRLMDADPDDKKHLVRLLRTFEHRGHLCLVFESLSMNLREVVKRYGKDVGLNLRAVRAYASQMFLALALMKKCDLMHADLKPDNILVNESKSTLKVCDLGSASDVSENDITPYLVSRFYRAPEIILGLPYDCSLDVWSIGCTLYELYTGKILFPGRTNNHMLLLMMETKGKFQNKVIKKARFGDQHFDENGNFLSVEKNDTVTPRQIPSKPPSDLRSRLMPPGVARQLKDDDARLLTHFVDLLDKMLHLEPSKRPSPKELLSHPFIRG
ncbi:hypothetical protein JCM10212_000913 [Sporobolomyces blumeae]